MDEAARAGVMLPTLTLSAVASAVMERCTSAPRTPTSRPRHRHYLWAKEIELTLGSTTRQLARLGARLAADDET